MTGKRLNPYTGAAKWNQLQLGGPAS